MYRRKNLPLFLNVRKNCIMSVFISYILFICLSFVKQGEASRYKIENVTRGDGEFLLSPQWSVQENALYWVDMIKQKIFRKDDTTGVITTREIGYGLTPMVRQIKDFPDYLIVAVHTSLYLLKWGASGGDEALKLLTTVDHDKPANNISDGSVDDVGRLWFGTFGPLNHTSPSIVVLDQATLYSIDANNYAHPEVKKRPVSLSTGITWSLDNKKMYYNDCPTRKVVVFDYDVQSGTIANESIFFDFDKHNIAGVPNGMTRDVDGNLWIATYTGRTVLQIDSTTSQILRQIELPVDQVNTVRWGGPHLDILFVTTGKLGLREFKPLSGALFKITGLGTQGMPENQFVFPNAPNF